MTAAGPAVKVWVAWDYRIPDGFLGVFASLDGAKAACEERCVGKGWRWVVTYDDEQGGKTLELGGPSGFQVYQTEVRP